MEKVFYRVPSCFDPVESDRLLVGTIDKLEGQGARLIGLERLRGESDYFPLHGWILKYEAA